MELYNKQVYDSLYEGHKIELWRTSSGYLAVIDGKRTLRAGTFTEVEQGIAITLKQMEGK